MYIVLVLLVLYFGVTIGGVPADSANESFPATVQVRVGVP